MRYLFKVLLVTLFLLSSTVAAVNIVECQDKQGNISFREVCPPKTEQISSKQFSIGSSKEAGSKEPLHVTLYIVSDCEMCQEVREFLQLKNIAFKEKDVSETIEVQEELTAIVGALKVPTTVIGSEIVTGYNRSKLTEILERLNAEDRKPPEEEDEEYEDEYEE